MSKVKIISNTLMLGFILLCAVILHKLWSEDYVSVTLSPLFQLHVCRNVCAFAHARNYVDV